MMTQAMDLTGVSVVDVDQQLYRNIISLRQSTDLFDDLSDDPADWAAGQRAEMVAKPPQFESQQPIIDRPFEDAEYTEAIGFPFDHWSASRYSAGHYGVWYGAVDLDTTIHETVHHWRTGLLRDTGAENVEGMAVERRVHLVRCRAGLLDLSGYRSLWPWLVSDTYGPCQALGARLHNEGHPGLFVPSARCAGTCTPILNPRVLSSPSVCCYLTYTIAHGQVRVERDPGTTLLTVQSHGTL